MGRFQEGKNGQGLSPHLKALRPWHKAMAQVVAISNVKPKELAIMYGMSEGQISRIMGSPLFQVEVAHLQSEKAEVMIDASADVQMMAQKALLVLDEDLDIEPTCMEARRHRQKNALDVLGVAGIGPKSAGKGQTLIQINNKTNQTQINVKDLSEKDLRDEVMDLLKDV